MKLINKKNNNNLVFLIIFFYYFLVSAFQASNNHWSARLDMDITMIYQSLLIYSGYEQSYIDHPAFTDFLILGAVYKFLSLFFSNFTVNEIFNSDNIDQNLQNLYAVARILNSFYFFIYSVLIYKILQELNIKKIICILSTIIIISFHSVYEILFLIRTEIVSINFGLLGFYFLLKFLNRKENSINCFLSGFFICLAIFSKVQIIFFVFIIILILPFLFNYYEETKFNSIAITNRKFFLYSSIFFGIFFLCYIFLEFNFIYQELNFALTHRRYIQGIPHFIDPILYSFFILFYFLLIKYLSLKKITNLKDNLSVVFAFLYGIFFCIGSLFALDLIGLIEFRNITLFFLTNPIHIMSTFTTKILIFSESVGKFNLNDILLALNQLFSENYKIFQNKKFAIKFGTIYVEILDLFRFLISFVASALIIILIFSKKSKKVLALSFLLFLGMVIYIVTFGARYSIGYNIYIYPFFLILVSLILNTFESKKFTYIIFLVILSVSLAEIYLLRDFHKYQFARENRIYEICKIEHWKNSPNYNENKNANSFIPLSRHPMLLIRLLIDNAEEEFFVSHCEQLEKKASWKTNFFNIKIE